MRTVKRGITRRRDKTRYDAEGLKSRSLCGMFHAVKSRMRRDCQSWPNSPRRIVIVMINRVTA